MGHSMLGPHINAQSDQIPWLHQARPPVGLVLFNGLDVGWMREAKAASPDTLWIGRLYVEHQPLDSPEQNAAAFTHGQLLPAAEPFRDYISALVSYNETGAGSVEEMARYARFERHRTELLHKAGWLSVVGNFSVGTPQAPEIDPAPWQAFYPALEGAFALGLHQYGAPTMQSNADWCSLRHRKVYASFPEHLRKLLLFITECGIDGGAAGQAQVGWKGYTDVAGYLSQMLWWDAELQADLANGLPVRGACMYLHGTVDNHWQSFNTQGEMAQRLATYMQANPPLPWKPKKEEPSMATSYLTSAPVYPAYDAAGWWRASREALGEKREDIRPPVLPVHPSLWWHPRPVSEVDTVVIHWSATSIATWATPIAQYHIKGDEARELEPAPGARYHDFVQADGRVRWCADYNRRVGHAGDADANARSIGLCFITNTRPTEDALSSAETFIRALATFLGRSLRVIGHRDVSGQSTDCPGPTWREWMPRLAAAGLVAAPVDWRQRAAELQARVTELETATATQQARITELELQNSEFQAAITAFGQRMGAVQQASQALADAILQLQAAYR